MKVTEKIEGYDSMSAEEKLKAIEELEIAESKDNSDEVFKLKEALNKASSDVSNYKKQLREKQSEQERLETERKEKENEREELLNKLLKEKSVAENKAEFLKHGYADDLATHSAEALVSGDFKSVFDDLGKFISNRDKETEVRLMDSTKKPAIGSVTPEVTKEQFSKMGIAERTKLYESNKELYDTLSKGE